jgi:hypothetical protein
LLKDGHFCLFTSLEVLPFTLYHICSLGDNIYQDSSATTRIALLLLTGDGARAVCPPGVLAKLGASVSEQNALMVALLLAPHGGLKIGHDDLPKLSVYMALNAIPVMHGMPPYSLWEEPPAIGRIPPHRTDVGAFLNGRSRRSASLHPGKG